MLTCTFIVWMHNFQGKLFKQYFYLQRVGQKIQIKLGARLFDAILSSWNIHLMLLFLNYPRDTFSMGDFSDYICAQPSGWNLSDLDFVSRVFSEYHFKELLFLSKRPQGKCVVGDGISRTFIGFNMSKWNKWKIDSEIPLEPLSAGKKLNPRREFKYILSTLTKRAPEYHGIEKADIEDILKWRTDFKGFSD